MSQAEAIKLIAQLGKVVAQGGAHLEYD